MKDNLVADFSNTVHNDRLQQFAEADQTFNVVSCV